MSSIACFKEGICPAYHVPYICVSFCVNFLLEKKFISLNSLGYAAVTNMPLDLSGCRNPSLVGK